MSGLTEDTLASMLRENTGRHFLDSGGAYGRHWERNQGRDFKSEPETTCKFQVRTYRGKMNLELDITHRTFHWLNARLTHDKEHARAMRACARFIRSTGLPLRRKKTPSARA